MDNPYATAGTDPAHQGSSSAISAGVLRALAGTKPWVRFCSIIGFIASGLMILAGLFMMVGGGLLAASAESGAFPFSGFPMVMGLIYIVFSIIYLFPSFKLWKYASSIANLLNSNSTMDLETALDAQRSFWKFVGILLAIIIGIYILIFGLAMIAGVFGALSS
ncbi:MAG: DUF5362 family protein [Verrucomicrobiota bacterium]